MKKIFTLAFVLIGTVAVYAQENVCNYDLEKISSFFSKGYSMWEFNDGIMVLNKDYKIGVINNKGEIVVPFEYGNIYSLGEMMVHTSKKGSDGKSIEGIINLVNGQLISNQYTVSCGKFYEGIAATHFNGQYALINKKGELVSTPLKSNSFFIEKPRNGMRLVKMTNGDKKMGAYNAKGQLVIPIKYDYIRADNGDIGFRNGIAKAKLNNKIVYLKKDGSLLKTAVAIIDGREFDDSLAFVKTAQGRGFIDTRGIFYNINNYPEFGNQYDDIVIKHTEGLLIAKNNKTNKFGFINKHGKVIVPIEYSSVEEFILGLAQVSKETENGKRYGYVNTKGELIVDCVYNGKRYISHNDNDYPNEYSDSIRIVCLDNKYGYVNNKGELISNVEYDALEHFYKGVGVVKKGEKYGFVDTKGQQISGIEYDKVTKSSDGIWLVQKGGKYGYVNQNGELSKIEFDHAAPFSYGIGRVDKDGIVGFVDINGKIYWAK